MEKRKSQVYETARGFTFTRTRCVDRFNNLSGTFALLERRGGINYFSTSFTPEDWSVATYSDTEGNTLQLSAACFSQEQTQQFL